MEELYQAIEEKIKASGYPREISGERVYDDKMCIRDRMEAGLKIFEDAIIENL